MDDEEALLYGDGDGGDNAGQAENEQLKENIESTEFQLEQEADDPVSITYSDFLSEKPPKMNKCNYLLTCWESFFFFHSLNLLKFTSIVTAWPKAI